MTYILLIYGLHMAYIWLICGLCSGCWWNMLDILRENHRIRRFYVDFTLLDTNPIPPNHLPYHFPTMDYQQESHGFPTQDPTETANSPWVFWGSPWFCWAIRTHRCIPTNPPGLYGRSLGEPGWHGSEAAPCTEVLALHKPRAALRFFKAQTSQKKLRNSSGIICSSHKFAHIPRNDAFSSSAASCWNMSKTCGMMLTEKLKTWGLSNQILGM